MSFDIQGRPQKGRINKLFVHYLRSYSDEWGTASVTIVGYTPKEMAEKNKGVSILHSKTDVHESQLAEAEFDVDFRARGIRITNLSGKVKIVELSLQSCETSM